MSCGPSGLRINTKESMTSIFSGVMLPKTATNLGNMSLWTVRHYYIIQLTINSNNSGHTRVRQKGGVVAARHSIRIYIYFVLARLRSANQKLHAAD